MNHPRSPSGSRLLPAWRLALLAAAIAPALAAPPSAAEGRALELTLVSSLAPLYHDVNTPRPPGTNDYFWFNAWLKSVDTDSAPYVRREILDQNLRDYDSYCKTIHRLGYRAVHLGDVIHLLTFDQLEPGKPHAIYPADHMLRLRHRVWGEYMRKFIEISHTHGLKLIMFSDEFVYTPEIEQWITSNGLPLTDENPRLWQVYREKYRELFREFPGIDGILLRLGEIYVYGSYRGKAIVSREGKEAAKYSRLVRETYDIVCKENQKLYFHRTWNLGTDGVHSRPDIYRAVFDPIPPDPNFYVAVKHTMTDFWYYQPMNPTIGIGHHQQLVEVQARNEFDGQGVVPGIKVYEVQSRLQIASGMPLVKGIYVWPAEGGVDLSRNQSAFTTIPYFGKHGFWNEASFDFVSKMAQNPAASPRAILREWASGKFGPAAADIVADVLLMSDQANKEVWYLKSYAQDTIWHPSPMRWFRLHDRGWDPYRPVLRNWQFGKMLEDNQEGPRLSAWMLRRFKEAAGKVADRQLYADALRSLEHFSAVADLLASWRAAKLYAYQLAAGGTGDFREPLRSQLPKELDRLQDLCSRYRTEYNYWDLQEVEASIRYMRAGRTDPAPGAAPKK
jgi:hypothetical protein